MGCTLTLSGSVVGVRNVPLFLEEADTVIPNPTFQILGMDIMDLPQTVNGNKHVLVIQDFLTTWPLVFPLPDQKTNRIVRILVEVIPFFEAILSDRGTNLMSHLMLDICKLLGIKKLNMTAYHPQFDGMVIEPSKLC